MDFLKKAKSQAKAAVQDAQGMYNTYKQQQQTYPPQAQAGYQQPQQYGAPQTYPPPAHPPQQHHQAPYNYQQGQAGYQPPHQPPQQAQPPPHHGYSHQPAQAGYQQPSHSPAQPAPQHGYSQQPQHYGYQQPPAPNYPQHPPPAQHQYQQPPAPQQQYQQPPPPQHQYQQPPGPPTPPTQPFDMNSMQQALPGAAQQAPYSPQSIQSPPPSAQPAAPPAAHYSPPESAPPPTHASAVPPATAPPTREVAQPAAPPAPADAEGLASPAPPPNAVSCPRHEPALVDMVQFYVFRPHVRSQIQPALQRDSFAACTACFNAYVTPYPNLAASFEPRQKTAAAPEAPQASFEKLACDFAMPSVRQLFYQQVVPQGSFMPLLQQAKYMVTLPPCSGSLMENSEYYESKRGDGFGTCKMCYEWFIRHTPFERELSLMAPASGWYCDIGARGYLYRTAVAELESRRPDFKRFSKAAEQRNVLRPCPGPGGTIDRFDSLDSVPAYEPPSGEAGVFCEACFWDKVMGTSMEPFFNKRIEVAYGSKMPCDLAGVPESFAMKAAIRAGNPQVWRRCVVGRNTFPKCIGVKGVDEEDLQGHDTALNQWHCVTEYASIEVCPLHHCAVVEIFGAGHLFSPINRPLRPGVIRMCFLAQSERDDADISDAKSFENTLVWRGAALRLWLAHGYDWHGTFYGFNHVAKVFASLPPPCGSNERHFKAGSGRKWYGNKFRFTGDEAQLGIRVCEECYVECVQGTPLDQYLGCDMTEHVRSGNPEGISCCTPGRRSRDELRDACEKGDFLPFARFWTAREQFAVYRNKISDLCNEQARRQQQQLNAINIQNQMASINLMNQLTANTNATIMRIGGSVAEASATDYGQRFGNSTIGHGYLTAAGANAAQASADAQALASGANHIPTFQPTGDTWQDTQQLLVIGRAVDATWNETWL